MVWQKNYGDPGASPGTLTPPPDAAAHVMVTAIHYTAEDYTETHVTDLQAYLQTAPRDGVLWFNVDGLGDVQLLETLGAHFGLHPLSLEDVLHIPQRAKIEDYEHYQFLGLSHGACGTRSHGGDRAGEFVLGPFVRPDVSRTAWR